MYGPYPAGYQPSGFGKLNPTLDAIIALDETGISLRALLERFARGGFEPLTVSVSGGKRVRVFNNFGATRITVATS